MPNQKRVYPAYKSQQFAGVVVFDSETKLKKIKMNSVALYNHFLNNVCKVGDEITLNISNKRPKRSLVQNNYLHLYLSLISLSSGHTIEELKIWLKGKFLTKGITEVFGDKVRIVKSTTELNISEFIELLEELENETGIPLPNTEPFLKPLTDSEYQTLKEKQRSVYQRLSAKIN